MLVSTFTLYVGLWTFETESASRDQINLVATVVIFTINIGFVVMVARVMGGALVRKVKEKLGIAPKELEPSHGIELVRTPTSGVHSPRSKKVGRRGRSSRTSTQKASHALAEGETGTTLFHA